jgi:hypothetical protein
LHLNFEKHRMSEEKNHNFIEEIIEEDLKAGKYNAVVTRFPPEPNGYLHMGHATSICLNFGLTKKFSGYTNLRFDDTNPVTEETEYVESIKEDIKWLGFEWKNELYASDYFDTLYDYAIKLIKKGLAYVDDSTSEEIAAQKGTPTEPGTDSPFRNRSIEENLDLFSRMKAGEFPDGSKTLRAKIDMAHPEHADARSRCCTASSMPTTTAPAINGAFTRCTILRMARATASSTLRTPFALWSLCPTASCTTGLLSNWKFSLASIRVCPAQPFVYRYEQAQAAATGK